MEPLGAASSGTTTDVATFLKIVRDATTTTPVTLDLGGHTISFEGRVREERLYIDRSFVTITNGTLLLPDMTVLVLRGQGIKLDRLTIKGPGSMPGDYLFEQIGLVSLRARMQNPEPVHITDCSIQLDDDPSPETSGLAISSPAHVVISGCTITGSGKCGLHVSGRACTVTVSDCTVRSCQLAGFLFDARCTAKLQRCVSAKCTHGFVCEGSNVEVGPGCRVEGCTEYGFQCSMEGAMTVGDGCSVKGGEHGFAACGRGSRLTVGAGCKVVRTVFGFWATEGGVLQCGSYCSVERCQMGFDSQSKGSKLTTGDHCSVAHCESGFAAQEGQLTTGRGCWAHKCSQNGFESAGPTALLVTGPENRAVACKEGCFQAFDGGKMTIGDDNLASQGKILVIAQDAPSAITLGSVFWAGDPRLAYGAFYGATIRKADTLKTALGPSAMEGQVMRWQEQQQHAVQLLVGGPQVPPVPPAQPTQARSAAAIAKPAPKLQPPAKPAPVTIPCAYCGAAKPQKQLKKCDGCKAAGARPEQCAFYCSVACEQEHVAAHQPACPATLKAKQEAEAAEEAAQAATSTSAPEQECLLCSRAPAPCGLAHEGVVHMGICEACAEQHTRKRYDRTCPWCRTPAEATVVRV